MTPLEQFSGCLSEKVMSEARDGAEENGATKSVRGTVNHTDKLVSHGPEGQ